jgi:hypothetical protein
MLQTTPCHEGLVHWLQLACLVVARYPFLLNTQQAILNEQCVSLESGKMSILLLPLTGCSTNPGPTTIETYFDDLEPDFQKFLQHSHGKEVSVVCAG